MATRNRGRIENLTPWKPGQTGNAGGRPRKLPLTDELRKIAQETLSPKLLKKLKLKGETSWARAIALAAFEKALRGDLTAIKMLLDYLEGKPIEQLRFEAPEGGQLNVQITNLTPEEEIAESRRRVREISARISERIRARAKHR